MIKRRRATFVFAVLSSSLVAAASLTSCQSDRAPADIKPMPHAPPLTTQGSIPGDHAPPPRMPGN